ncbi:jmjC domain-containing protein 8 [Eucyclogobius newberryi]|uniref:jmjC domain-containing protein 8 n=1 Tax=Eucyclogobius newberryi TaxID=166745 RepID=UPI003B5C17F0
MKPHKPLCHWVCFFWLCCGFARVFAQVQREDEDGGGWRSSADPTLDDGGRCNIPVLDNISYKDFMERFAFSGPVILRGLTDNTKFRRLCSKKNLLREYGDRTVRLSTANTHSYRKVDVSFREYVENFLRPQAHDALGNDTLYFFGDNNQTEWQHLFSEYSPPPFTLPHTTRATSFGVAGAGTGVPFHWHGPGFSEVIYGRKRWFLFPPDKQPHFHPNMSSLSWVTHSYSSLTLEEAPLECTIRPGEVLYFPDRWWHATLNLDTSVFISTFLG